MEYISLTNLPSVKSFSVYNNNYYSTMDGVLLSSDKKVLLCYPKGKEDTEYQIPDGVSTIGKNAFNLGESKKLKKVLVSEPVKEICDFAFWTFHANDTEVEFVDNNVEILGKNVFTCFSGEKKVRFYNVKTYRGGAFIRGSLENVSFGPNTIIEYSEEIDYREYIYYNVKRIYEETDIKEFAEISFSYGSSWMEGKRAGHHFETIIEIHNKQMLNGFWENTPYSENITVSNNEIVYKFACNPEKMHYGQRTYKKYLDGIKDIFLKIKNYG